MIGGRLYRNKLYKETRAAKATSTSLLADLDELLGSYIFFYHWSRAKSKDLARLNVVAPLQYVCTCSQGSWLISLTSFLYSWCIIVAPPALRLSTHCPALIKLLRLSTGIWYVQIHCSTAVYQAASQLSARYFANKSMLPPICCRATRTGRMHVCAEPSAEALTLTLLLPEGYCSTNRDVWPRQPKETLL